MAYDVTAGQGQITIIITGIPNQQFFITITQGAAIVYTEAVTLPNSGTKTSLVPLGAGAYHVHIENVGATDTFDSDEMVT